ncbi:beta-1,4-galactosyltransferase 4-like [Mya arenaria]|uniref:beta-1,4-galactosyltransferase 4-like n=1 Tax=Mya arenaria TaxID=6604 RepID=UPI0022E832FA|nr:beta-1,4-galactosyltransferase 4-like [Mya arenaria]
MIFALTIIFTAKVNYFMGLLLPIPKGICNEKHNESRSLGICNVSNYVFSDATGIQNINSSCFNASNDINGVLPGGIYEPDACISSQTVAIIVPYRDRPEHLKIFLKAIHSFLKKQNISYGIYVLELALPTTFNRGLLLNIGYLVAKSEKPYDCFIFHDVDLIPTNERNMYLCNENALHMSTFNTKFFKNKKNAMPYADYIGGVLALTDDQFRKVNGFSNLYFGWGGEDDDMFTRLKINSVVLTHVDPEIGQYYALPHSKDPGNPINPKRFTLLKKAKQRMAIDGLSAVGNLYTIQKKEYRLLYTWLNVVCNQTDLIKRYNV